MESRHLGGVGGARPYGTTTTTLKNLNAGLPPAGTSAHGPSSAAAPFSTACISAPVQRFVFGSHSTFDLPSTSYCASI